MSGTFQRIPRLVVTTTAATAGQSAIPLLTSLGTFTPLTIGGGLSGNVCNASVSQAGSAYNLMVSDSGVVGNYFGTSSNLTAASLLYDAASGVMTQSGRTRLDLTTGTGGGYVSSVKPFNSAAELSIGSYGGADLGTIVKSGTFASANTYTLPDLTGTFVLDAGNQSIGGTKTFTGTVIVPTPTLGTHAATKNYVDSVAQGLDFKESCRVTTTANVALTGAVPLVIDGVTVAGGNRILLKNQTTASQNGIYTAAIAGTYTLTRSTDADTSAKVTSGLYTYVEEGTAGGGYAYVLATTNPIVLDTTSLTFVVFNAPTVYTAGNGLQLIGQEFSVASTITTNQFVANTSMTTPSINPAVLNGTITFNNADLTSIDALSAASATIPIINGTGTTTLGNVGGAMTINGSTVGITGDTSVTGDLDATHLRAKSDSVQVVLGLNNTNNIVVSAASSGLSEQKTYTLPASTTSTATFALIQGSAPPTTDYVLAPVGTGHLATWVPSVSVNSVQASITTTAVTQTNLITFATTSGRFYVFKAIVTAKDSTTNEQAVYEFDVPVKNVGGTLTIGSYLFSAAAVDAGFTGGEVIFDASGSTFRARTTPPSTNSTNWKTYLAYHFTD